MNHVRQYMPYVNITEDKLRPFCIPRLQGYKWHSWLFSDLTNASWSPFFKLYGCLHGMQRAHHQCNQFNSLKLQHHEFLSCFPNETSVRCLVGLYNMLNLVHSKTPCFESFLDVQELSCDKMFRGKMREPCDSWCCEVGLANVSRLDCFNGSTKRYFNIS